MLSRTIVAVWALLGFIACSGCETRSNTAEAEQCIYRTGSFTDVSWWTHDDEDQADETYLSFASQTYTSGDDEGVYVDVPDCTPTNTFRATFSGIATGGWQYRAAVRLTVEQNEATVDIHGAQTLLAQPASPSDIVPVNISGVFTVPSTGACRIGIKGKAFSGEVRMFSGATLVVERYR